MRNLNSLTATGFTLLGLVLSAGVVSAQEGDEQSAADTAESEALPEISDEPKTIDPATLLPEQLAASATIDFTDSTLTVVAQWIEEEQEMPVLFDQQALSSAGILLAEPVSDHLHDDPIYLLLNRLSVLGLAWYVEDEVVHITTEQVAQQRMTTQPYNIGDLLDKGYVADDVIEPIQNTIEGPWFDIDGKGGTVQVLGDVLFVRQTDEVHREVGGLLAALRNHGRRTFILDPPQHIALREKLEENVSVEFLDTPLVAAVQELGLLAEADIRLDMPALRESRVRDREPVSLVLTDRKLSTILQVMVSDLGLTWILRDGVLWVTSGSRADSFVKTAVFDVRDLCRDDNESLALLDAVQNQTAGPWFDLDGIGGRITFPQSGTMVVRQTERLLKDILNLLETYREALRLSRPREREVIDPNEVITTYYRVQADVARDLVAYLPVLVRPGTWQSDEQPEAEGTILQVTSDSELLGTQIVPQSVLIIHQSRAAHEEIAKVIQRVQRGDVIGGGGDEVMGGGFGGGGFGGGFFSTD